MDFSNSLNLKHGQRSRTDLIELGSTSCSGNSTACQGHYFARRRRGVSIHPVLSRYNRLQTSPTSTKRRMTVFFATVGIADRDWGNLPCRRWQPALSDAIYSGAAAAPRYVLKKGLAIDLVNMLGTGSRADEEDMPETCGWRIDTEAVKRLDSRNALRSRTEELQREWISFRVFTHGDLHIAGSARL
jgi:hypothetical protein